MSTKSLAAVEILGNAFHELCKRVPASPATVEHPVVAKSLFSLPIPGSETWCLCGRLPRVRTGLLHPAARAFHAALGEVARAGGDFDAARRVAAVPKSERGMARDLVDEVLGNVLDAKRSVNTALALRLALVIRDAMLEVEP